MSSQSVTPRLKFLSTDESARIGRELEILLTQVKPGQFIEILRVQRKARVSVSAQKYSNGDFEDFTSAIRLLLQDECEQLKINQTIHLRITDK
jgi:hypothetical protein